MSDIIRILIVFAFIVLLLRLRWNLGLVMLLAAILLGVFYRVGPVEQARVIIVSATDMVTLSVVAALALIMVLENIIRKQGLLKRMTDSLVNVARDRRIAMAVLPGVIGLLPSAGGAAFSAPLVQEVATDESISAERKAFINYWFRHVWEYISPLYPGIVLAVAITGVSLNSLLLSQIPLPLAVVGAGAYFGFRRLPKGVITGSRSVNEIRTLIVTLLPIIASIILVVVFKLNLAVAMAGIVIVLFVLYRYSTRELVTTMRESLSFNILLMVVGIMVFKGMLVASGAIDALPAFFEQSGLPHGVVLFALPFLVGILTGVTIGFVGAAFPIITVMMGGTPEPAVLTFAFASGFAGVMLSPTHLCFILTCRFLKADMAGVYRMLTMPVLLVLAVGFIRFVIG